MITLSRLPLLGISRLLVSSLLVTLVACGQADPTSQSDSSQTNTAPTSNDQVDSPQETATDPDASTDADAIVSAIAAPPVWVKAATADAETSAQVGTQLAYGDTVRTAEPGLAEIELDNGLAFRIGGDTALTLEPDNRLQLEAGEMITWVEPGKQVSTEIVTPAGIAGLRGTTLFVKIPADGQGEVLFFAWEGTIRFRPTDSDAEILLRGGEELRVRPGERDIAALRRRIRRLDRRELRMRRRRSRLHGQFRRPLPTEAAIDRLIERSRN